ncbi:MAG: RNA methyltransferase [Hyphomicrobiaceae bacterium]|nr:RNA methyltransferase [Hyphomicrobiaceae bacterium]
MDKPPYAHKRKGPPQRGAAPGGRPFRKRQYPGTLDDDGPLLVFGLHAVDAALDNEARTKIRLHASRNALARLTAPIPEGLPVIETTPRDLDRLLGSDTVHQGVALEVEPLDHPGLEAVDGPLVLILDQVTDPHNVGAILRSAAAFAASAVMTTTRHAPRETGTLAKSASGALEIVPLITVRNLAEAMETLKARGYQLIGLDGAAESSLAEAMMPATPTALVLGSEGKGLRQKTMATCDRIGRLALPGALTSLNVSNAAALGLYIAREKLG